MLFGTSLIRPGKAPKPVKPHEVSLYNTRDTIDPSVNLTRQTEISPFAPAANEAATQLATRLGSAPSPLLGQLEAQAGDELALGGELSPDEIRLANQSALASWSTRGLTRSPGAGFGAVLARLQFSNQRKAERRGFASNVVGMQQQQRAGDVSSFGVAAGAGLGAYGLAEEMRQDELTRLDALKNYDKTAAVNLKIGKDQAATAKTAGTASGIGSIFGGILGALKF